MEEALLDKHLFMFNATSVLQKDAMTGTIQKSSGNAWFAELDGEENWERRNALSVELTDMSWKSMLESQAWHDWLPSWQNIHRNVSHHCRWQQPLHCPFVCFSSKYFSLVLRTGDFANNRLRPDHTHSVHYWSNRRTPLISRRILIVNYPLKSPSKHKILHTLNFYAPSGLFLLNISCFYRMSLEF